MTLTLTRAAGLLAAALSALILSPTPAAATPTVVTPGAFCAEADAGKVRPDADGDLYTCRFDGERRRWKLVSGGYPTTPPTTAPPTTPPPTTPPPTVPPTVPPTDTPPPTIPPTDVPPTDVPPTEVPPTEVPPTEVPPTTPPQQPELPVTGPGAVFLGTAGAVLIGFGILLYRLTRTRRRTFRAQA